MTLNSIPSFNPNKSLNAPTINGAIAPPTIPVHKIPANDPWCSFTEFKANENTIDHITEAKNPTAGKAINAISFEAYKAVINDTKAKELNTKSTFLLSINFNKTNPKKHPTVNAPQKFPTAAAPIVSGFTL